MRDRVRQLRNESVDARAVLSPERAVLMTQFYRDTNGTPLSAPMKRALSFKYLLEHKAIHIGHAELIVGEKGPEPKASPTYPELCCHTVEDLGRLNSRDKVSFHVSDETRRIYETDMIPYWLGKSMRDLILDSMTSDWTDAYEAGVFTEFMEQRSPGHTVLGDKIYDKGMLDIKRDIAASLENIGDDESKGEELRAMDICADAIIAFAERHAQLAQTLAAETDDEQQKAELKQIAATCSHVPAHAPRTFREAIQYYWFVHLGVTTELNPWDSFSPGRLDQHLQPFYKRETADGSLTRDDAEELLQCLWIKFNNQLAPPKVGVTARESNTYTDFAQINTGGLTQDGNDGVNDVTYIILDVIQDMRLIQPSPSIQVSEKSPDEFIKRAGKIIRDGFGQPSTFNCDMIVEELTRQGKSVEDARNGGTSGCVETGTFGKENYNLCGYFSLPKVMQIVLHNGIDPHLGRKVGLETGDPRDFKTVDDLLAAFKKQLNYFVDVKIKGDHIIEQLYMDGMPAPFLSILIDDCITNGTDYHNGGARYNTTYLMGVGIGTATDMISAIKTHVLEDKTVSMGRLLKIMADNYEGHEPIRQMLLNKTPRYGNDDDRADDIMRIIFNAFLESVEGHTNLRNGTYHANFLSTTVHVYFGSMMGATPDGRRFGEALSEGVSPVQGADRKGPTASLKSVSKMDHSRTGGTLLNQKFSPQALRSDRDLDNLVKLIRSYFKLGGHHVQFNVVNRATLIAAKEDPDLYRDLIVRVAGYSDYFCDLTEPLQNEIIARTEHAEL